MGKWATGFWVTPLFTRCGGLSNNRTASGVSGPVRAELPPLAVPMWLAPLRGRSCNGWVALSWLPVGRSYFAAYAVEFLTDDEAAGYRPVRGGSVAGGPGAGVLPR